MKITSMVNQNCPDTRQTVRQMLAMTLPGTQAARLGGLSEVPTG